MGSSSNSVNSYKTCYCGAPAPIKVSRTSDNPGRRFFGCQNYKVQPCAFFKWVDEDDGIESRMLEFHCRVQELQSTNQQLQRRYEDEKKKCEELKKQVEVERKAKNELKKKYESVMVKKKVALYLICFICLWKIIMNM